MSKSPPNIRLDTRFGTVFNYEVDLNKKRLGIGVMNGFIGGCLNQIRVILISGL